MDSENNDTEVRKLTALLALLRKARDDADEAILATETLLGLAKRRRPGNVTSLRPALHQDGSDD